MRSALALGAALALALAACGGGGTPAPAAPTSAPADGATEAPSSTDSGSVVAVDTAPCDLLTAEEVEAATGLSVAEVRDEPPISCVFDLGAEAGVSVFVSVEDGEGRAMGPAAVFDAYGALVDTGEAENVGGVGSAAIFAPGFRGLVVDAGQGRFIALGVNGGFNELDAPLDALATLARAAVDRL